MYRNKSNTERSIEKKTLRNNGDLGNEQSIRLCLINTFDKYESM